MPEAAADYLAYQQNGGAAILSDRAKLRLTGADRVRYLNGQVTANVTRLGTAEAAPACVTTAKGRLCGEIFISATPEALLIDAEGELREPLLARLERYIISDDAVLEDATESLALLHLLPAQGQILETMLTEDLTALQPRKARRFGPAGFDVFLPASAAEEFLQHRSMAPRLSAGLLEVVRIEHGIPRWGRELNEETLPPEAGLDLTHVDYHKGCYIGQEVISRLKSVGHVNRRLVGFVLADALSEDTKSSLRPGASIFASPEETKPIGEITSAAYSFALAKPIALGYLKRVAPMEGLFVRHGDTSSPSCSVLAQELPFVESR